MPISTENLFINAFKTVNGWTKFNDTSDINNQIQYRCIRIGNQINCNGELIKNIFIKKQFEHILNEHNITDYEIEEIDNKDEYSFQLKLSESVYQELKEKMIKDDSKFYASNI
tara:strand:- start:1496 stop:1834 length:339 start_codon:yes stop_codon:yes gene_type:complete